MNAAQLSCGEFLDALASKSPTPGGGGASALVGALGAALASMVGNYTLGKQKYAGVEAEVQALMVRTEELRTRLLAQVDADAAAFEPLSRAYAIPKDDPARGEVMERCLREAAAPPMEILRLSCQAIDLHQAMLEKGLWGEEAYLDLGRGMLFRSHEAAEDQERQERQREAPQVPQEAEEGYSGMLRSIRRSNDRIADPELSRKMDRLEEIAGKILKLVEEDPAKKNQAATFLNYYLPTTEKLLDSYADFEEAGVSGENLTQAKEKIRRTMDSIMAGFERQLDALYHADAMDVDSDIRVMETMLRRDGGSVEEDFGLGGTAVATQEEDL